MKVKVLIGCNYPPDDTRAEPGDVIDVPDETAKNLIRHDAVEPHKATKESKASKSKDSTDQQTSDASQGQGG
jgi:hypothetical protein